MRKSLAIVLSSLALAAASLTLFVGSPQAADNAVKVTPTVKWEYASSPASENHMNAKGADGWEAFAVAPETNGVIYTWYKRPKN